MNNDIPKLIIGTFGIENDKIISDLICTAVKSEIKIGIDTAPSYKNAELIGNSIQSCLDRGWSRNDFFITDKIDIIQMINYKGKIESFVESRLRKLQTDYIDLLLIHWPYDDYFIETWLAFINLFSNGKIKKIGVCNIRERHIKKLITTTNFKPHVVQIERHPLNNFNELINYLKNQNIRIQAYSPFARMHNKITSNENLINISKRHNKELSQIILAWNIQNDIIPVFKTSKSKRIISAIDSININLSKSDIAIIDSINEDYKFYLESLGCPNF
jgi:diketogulonate reductase-like aldo/keto reductase